MFDALARPLASLLAFFYSLIPSYMVAIILLTLVIMLLLTPLTVKSTRSMLAMQRLQPEIKRLQQQHKNDRQALNEAMMAFYKEHNVNPLSGCLPMLLQMPVFFALYEAIRGLTHNPPKVLNQSSELFKAVCSHPQLDSTGKVTSCLTSEGSKAVITLKSWGMDLAKTVSDSHGSFARAVPFYLLIALTTATQYYQQRQLNNRNPNAAAANPQMQMTQKFLPLIFLFIYIRIPAAIVVYFLVSNLLRIGQQGAMWRWDPKLKAEVASEVREVEAKTKSIEAKSKQVPNKGKGGRPDKTPGKTPPPAPKQPPPKGGTAKAPPPAKRGPEAKEPGNGKGQGGGQSPSAGRPNVAKPNRPGQQSPRQQRGRRGR